MPRGVPRRERRFGVQYIRDNRERDITFYKRRGGLFKSAADLSVLTGARVAVILETPENGKMHSFGTPLAERIVDAFLSGVPPIGPLTDQATSARIAFLQSELARLDMENTVEEKKTKLSTQVIKEIQDENPGMVANLLFSRQEDLCLADLIRLFNEFSRVQQNIARRVPPLHRVPGQNGASMSTIHPPPRVPSWGPLPPQSSSPDILRQQPLCPAAAIPLAPQHMMAPNFPVQVPEILQPTLPAMSQQIPNLLQDLPSAFQSRLQNYTSRINTVEPPQNNAVPNSTFEHSELASPLLVYTGGNNFDIDDPFGNEHWRFTLSDQPQVSSFLEMAGTDVGQAEMGNGGWVNEPPEPSSGRGDVN
ncbi:uncharacterized protein LOC104582323 [Brachypodium distachyon]|uniref:uncharacterized protein LOC104582323 n=1 Tax=Brachypodium distachyon TaxID=15368 RepID=UPI0005300187|nr:uncharacterized protein LOC104582323 [Brachypodium distachyon]|eukprot:XP_010230084.1 uncharacterized protein LOC104582323 [Brachypodium distachyon]